MFAQAIIDEVAAKTGNPRHEVERMVDAIGKVSSDRFSQGCAVGLPGGPILLARRRVRFRRNANTQIREIADEVYTKVHVPEPIQRALPATAIDRGDLRYQYEQERGRVLGVPVRRQRTGD